MRARVAAAFAAGAAALVAGCSSSGDDTAATRVVRPSASERPVADGLAAPSGSTLSRAHVKRLVQYFEDKVSAAYAAGDADALSKYLAGPMLSGNRATITLLNKQHKRNVFRIKVRSVKPTTNTAHQVIVDMTGDMVADYFVDSRTHQVLNHGLPGPSQVRFAIFLDQNPQTGTWYWTGAQSEANSTGSTG